MHCRSVGGWLCRQCKPGRL